ncbi:peptidyl-prolyl cis-trans isomerase [Sediminicola sp. 1XM1-17]|uniref:peptidyl-prolyl cis-trans isomerase n=1 Tax=Sediminicola sp. 1XM1-17 TaxID=3127702 RepID=UPI0030771E68
MMFLLARHISKIFSLLFVVALLLLGASCDGLWKKEKENKAIARVGDVYLYEEDIAPLITDIMSKEDSASVVSNFINTWASKQLLLSKSKINLPVDKLAEFDKLVDDYRIDLYTRAYKEALVQQALDTTVNEEELYAFYENEKENFKLQEKLLMIRFVELPPQFLKKDAVADRLRRFNKRDKAYLDSVSVQFRKLNLNDSVWVKVSRVVKEIPPLSLENEDQYLKKSQFFEIQDSLGVYLGKVIDVLNVNDVAPLPFIRPTIRQVLLNRRRLDYMRKLETEIIDEAVKEKEFEIYEQDE